MELTRGDSSPTPKAKDTTSEPCRICERRLRHLDGLTRLSRYASSIGSWSVVQSRTSCAFCRLVVAAVNRSRRADFQARFPSDADLSPDGDEEVKITWDSCPPGFEINLAPGTTIAFVDSSSSSPSDERGPANAFKPECLATSSLCRARLVNGLTFDGGLAKKWLRSCEVHHGEQCKPIIDHPALIFADRALQGKDWCFRLIDVHHMKIASFGIFDLINQSPRYAILSYVWGAGVPSLRLLKENYKDLISIGSLKRRRAEIPETILNAIELVQSADLQYLWVDAFCLVQDDESDKELNIPRMHAIYGGATLAILAAAGPHARVGLPGIGVTPRRCAQIREEISPGVTMAVVNDVKIFLEESHYAKRGWTFQEQMLSNRTIIFTPDGSVYYRCLKSVWSEDTNDDARPTETAFYPDYLYAALAGHTPWPSAYNTLLRAYSGRSLINQHDALNAFAGLQHILETRSDDQFLVGIPACAFDLFCLFTGYHAVLKRRKEFPSWSWAGWIGPVQLCEPNAIHSVDECQRWLNERTWIRWRKVAQSGKNDPVWDPVRESADRKLQYRARAHFRCRSSPGLLEGKSAVPSPDVVLPPPLSKNHIRLQFWTLSLHLRIREVDKAVSFDAKNPSKYEYKCLRGRIVDRDRKLVGSVHLDDELVTIGQGRRAEFIVLSECKDLMGGGSALEEIRSPIGQGWDLYWVMFLKWDESFKVAERRGIGQILQEAVNTCLEPGVVWKEIILG